MTEPLNTFINLSAAGMCHLKTATCCMQLVANTLQPANCCVLLVTNISVLANCSAMLSFQKLGAGRCCSSWCPGDSHYCTGRHAGKQWRPSAGRCHSACRSSCRWVRKICSKRCGSVLVKPFNPFSSRKEILCLVMPASCGRTVTWLPVVKKTAKQPCYLSVVNCGRELLSAMKKKTHTNTFQYLKKSENDSC